MKLFIGIGLMCLLDTMRGSLGGSIGVLVTLYGAGQAFIASTSRRNANVEEEPATEEPAKEDTTETK